MIEGKSKQTTTNGGEGGGEMDPQELTQQHEPEEQYVENEEELKQAMEISS